MDMNIERMGFTHSGLRVYRIDGREYAVGTDKQATRAALACAEGTLWAFNTAFIARYVPALDDDRARAAVGEMQARLCEDAGPIIAALLGRRKREMLRAAIDEDGRGHFLAQYDGAEVDGEDIHPSLKGKVAFRIH